MQVPSEAVPNVCLGCNTSRNAICTQVHPSMQLIIYKCITPVTPMAFLYTRQSTCIEVVVHPHLQLTVWKRSIHKAQKRVFLQVEVLTVLL
jgi:hypothetical protein